METTIGPYEGASASTCTDGRQIGENHTYPSHYMKVTYTTKVTNLRGSREGCPINESALQAVLNNWKNAIEVIAYVRSQQIERMRLNPGPFDYVELMVLAEICTALPAYLIRRNQNPIQHDAIPADIATVYKLIAGLKDVVGFMVSVGDPRLIQSVSPTAASIYAYADQNKLFSSRNMEVCGGPEKMILKFLDITINGYTTTNVPDVRNQIDTSILRKDNVWLDYGLHCAAVKFAYAYFRTEMEQAAHKLTAHQHASSNTDNKILRRLFDMLLLPELTEPLRGENESIRRTVLGKTIHSVTSVNLSNELANFTPNMLHISPNIVDDIGPISAQTKTAVDEFIYRYNCIFGLANDFMRARQQEINHILGRSKSAAPEKLKILSKICNAKTNHPISIPI